MRAGVAWKRSNGCGHVDDAALRLDALERLGEREAARDLLVQEQPDDLAVVGGLDLRADDDVQRQPALDRARAGLDAARDRVVIGDRERAEAGRERRVEQLVDGRRAIPRVLAVHVQVGQHAAGSRAHRTLYRFSFTTGAARGHRRAGAGVHADELLDLLARVLVGVLHRRRLHEVRRRELERAGEAVVERQLGEAHGVDDDAGRVGESQTSSLSSTLSGTSPNERPSRRM